jgi:hypothetical protein
VSNRTRAKAGVQRQAANGYFYRAERFYQNARETLSTVPILYDRYQDDKPVREASQMAYLAVLQAIKGALFMRGVPTAQLPRREDALLQGLSKLKEKNGKLVSAFNTVYENLHIFAHYDGGCNVPMVKSGMSAARFVIEKLTGARL